MFPSLSEAVNKSKGKIFPSEFLEMLKQMRKTKSLDFGLIAFRPEYQNKGLNRNDFIHIIDGMIKEKKSNMPRQILCWKQTREFQINGVYLNI